MSNDLTTILIADDDEMLVEALAHQLEFEGYRVLCAEDGDRALEVARQEQPDLLLLDIMMPKRQGWDVCRELRQESTIPILMLTARSAEMDRVVGLEMGADDYIVKPFSFRELLARIRANLRRVQYQATVPQFGTNKLHTIGPLTIDTDRHRVTMNKCEVILSYKEYGILVSLLEAAGSVVERDALINQVWGEDWEGGPRTLDVYVRRLRSKIERDPANPQLVLTIRGVGYRLVTEDEI